MNIFLYSNVFSNFYVFYITNHLFQLNAQLIYTYFILLINLIIGVIKTQMNTQQKQKILKKYLSELTTFQSQLQSSTVNINTNQFDSYQPPQIDLVSNLIQHQKQINKTVDSTYESVRNVLNELSQLQTRKLNINKLLDSMTAIKDVKRLSYGLGNNPSEIYKNLTVYYQTKDKLYYCDKYIEKVQQQIVKVKANFQNQLQQQLKKTNSDNISEIAKTLSLISQNSSKNIQEKVGPHDNIVKFYVQLVKKQLKICQQDLFKIPTTSFNLTNCYIFFDIAKEVMKIIAATIKNYKGNVIKIGGEQVLQRVINDIFAFIMSGIMLEIFTREKKYFDFQIIDPKKMSKDQNMNKFKNYLNQFCAIWNQIQRLKGHLMSQIPNFSPLHKGLQNSLDNSINSRQLITINSQTSEAIKTYTRLQFNNLLKISPFVNSMYVLDYQFLNGIIKSSKQQYESQQAQDFVVATFQVIMKPLQKAFQSLNMIVISPFITFANNNLVQEDSFHAFNQLFSKAFTKLPSSQPKYFTAIVLIFNTILIMPGTLKKQIQSFNIPVQLQSNKVRLESQLKELIQVCDYKGREVINTFIQSITSASWFTNELKQDYKKALDKWKGFAPSLEQIFLLKVSKLHCSILLQEQFNTKSPKKIISTQGIISLQKQIRNIITYYEVKGCSALISFKKVLQYIQILLAENEDNANKLVKKFGLGEPDEIQRLSILRGMKTG